MLQTKITDTNRKEFYQHVYFMQKDAREQLVDLDQFNTTCIVVDCCGWHYKNIFQKDIVAVETINSAKEYLFSKDQFDKLIVNLNQQFVWPAVDAVDPVLIFDRSPCLRYLGILELCEFISAGAEKYQAEKIVVRHMLTFVDDPRLSDRFYNFGSFHVKNYCVEKFAYDTCSGNYFIQLKRLTKIE